MDTLLYKLCEKSEEELWEMLKQKEWSPEHVRVTYYLTEIMKAVKKMKYLEKVEESMDWGIEEMKKQGEEDEKPGSEFARRYKGREMGDEYARSRAGRSRIVRYDYYDDYDRGQGRGGQSGGPTNTMTSYNYFPMTPEQIIANPEMKEKIKKMIEEEEKKEKGK